jgi:hypothetical protein
MQELHHLTYLHILAHIVSGPGIALNPIKQPHAYIVKSGLHAYTLYFI